MLKRAFLTYVRPLVECISVVWSPYYKQDIESIERIQRRFSKRLPGLKNLSYEECLKYLGWPTLELRRLRTDLIWCYKILFGLVHFNADQLFQLRSNHNRGHRFKLYKQFSSSNTRSFFFTQRVINMWNSLPLSVEFSSLNAFKKSVEHVNLNQNVTVYKFPLCVSV